jgi:hypothetical protein
METGRNALTRTDVETSPRQRPITFWVPAAEADDLIAAAELEGRSLGSYIRARLFVSTAAPSPTGPALDMAMLTRLQGPMDRAAADLHELLRWVKSGHSPLAEEFRAALADCRTAAASIRQALSRKPGRSRR